ncbi:hypothetical protein NDU88_006022 [Pleurodeles waltl]|uniref:Uncharacterized protein n=1 Tax=Pleurodeles waltl TaxID=8319 RepID=A0AAV7TX84_PLEWA|nr:hypothetical protein NDU88_006022 [Pleurodeles waltl]
MELEEPITLIEIQDAIRALANGKTPGPDVLPAKFYKAYALQLAPHIYKLYEEAFATVQLPDTVRNAILILLLQLHKDPTNTHTDHWHY